MNREIIKQYWAELEHWVNDGSVLYRITVTGTNGLSLEGKWRDVPDSYYGWTDENRVYIINDKYVEFRMALAEGKTLQTSCIQNEAPYWVDIPKNSKFSDMLEYRIKPDEPKFKVGDYIVMNGSNSPHLIKNVFGDSYRCEDDYDYRDSIRLWTLEEADEADWVCIVDYYHTCWTCVQVCTIDAEMNYHISKPHVKVFPYIGQSPKELGL